LFCVCVCVCVCSHMRILCHLKVNAECMASIHLQKPFWSLHKIP